MISCYCLWIGKNSKKYFKQTREYMEGQNIKAGGDFAEIILKEPLSMVLRGTKKSMLCSCKCQLPFLNIEAESINHVYTLLSTHFEKSRRSHSGNVFQKIYYSNQNGWYPLDHLRKQCEAEEEDDRYIKKAT